MTARIAILAVLLLALAGCGGAAGTPSQAADPGALLIRPVYEAPPGDEPISMGGYGFFATIGDVTDERIPGDDVLRIDVPAGTHELTIVTKPQSDVLEPGQEEPPFYDPTAECTAEIEVPAGETVEVVYRAVGGSTCEILTPEG